MYSCKNIGMQFFLKVLLSLISEISICAEKVGFPRSSHICKKVNLKKMLKFSLRIPTNFACAQMYAFPKYGQNFRN